MNFYETSEQIDNMYFKYFNDNIKWFKEMNRQDHYSRVDWLCKDDKDRISNVELKLRTNDINQYENIFIEEDKMNYMMESYEREGYIPLYINFFQDKYHVGIWNLTKYKWNKPNLISKVIYDKGDNRTKLVNRFLLPTRACFYYVFDEKIKKYVKQW